MSKKTKSEKITADARRAFYKFEAVFQTPQNTTTKAINHTLIHDLRKTAILTGIIVTAQILLFLALKNKVILIPGISY